MSGKRFLERKDIGRLVDQAKDFTIRWRGVHVLLVGSAIVISVVSLLLLYASVVENSLQASYAFPIFLLLAVTLGLVIALHFCFVRVTYVEFLCLLFASSARSGTEFIMIMNRRGIVVYCDDSYDKIFKELPDTRDFQEFLALDGIKQKDSDKLVKALMDRESAKVPFEYVTEDGKKQKVELSLTPLPRPASYSMLKAVKI